MLCKLCYKYHFDIDYALNLTIPQVKILGKNLGKFNKEEAGTMDNDSPSQSFDPSDEKYLANRTAFSETLKMLKEKTGKETFTLPEMLNPGETLKKYRK